VTTRRYHKDISYLQALNAWVNKNMTIVRLRRCAAGILEHFSLGKLKIMLCGCFNGTILNHGVVPAIEVEILCNPNAEGRICGPCLDNIIGGHA
jgi:hypothetical protein